MDESINSIALVYPAIYLLYFCRKSRYLGMWKDDKYHGPGILLDESSFDVTMHSNGEKIVSQCPVWLFVACNPIY